jgi:hypothetical protein
MTDIKPDIIKQIRELAKIKKQSIFGDFDDALDVDDLVENINHDLSVLAQALADKYEILKEALEEIQEIYAGMDGFVPETAPEGYQQRIIRKMYEAAQQALKQVRE